MQSSSTVRSPVGLEEHGIQNYNAVYWNLSTPLLYEEAIRRREAGWHIWVRSLSAPDSTPVARRTTSSSSKSRAAPTACGGARSITRYRRQITSGCING